MSKRNFILLIIIFILAVAGIFAYLYFNQTTLPGESEGTNFISRFNPFGSKTPTPPPTEEVPPPVEITDTELAEEEVVALKKVSSMPVAGFVVFQKERLKEIPIVIPTPAPATSAPGEEVAPVVPPKTPEKTKASKPTPPPTEFMPALRYVDKATGNIYQTFADKIEEKKFSTTIIPKIYEAVFGNKGESVIMRYIKEDGETVATFVGNLPKEYLGGDLAGENEIKGSFLPENIKEISLSLDSLSVFYMFNTGDNMVGTTLNLLTNKKVQIFDSAFTEWLPFWSRSNMITLTTKPASSVPGYVYTLDPGTKNFTKLFGNINGLTTLASPNGKLILYGNNNLALGVYPTDTKVPETLGVRTLPDKCVWGKGSDVVYCAVPRTLIMGGYPDSWYRGEESFSDRFWKIDVKTGTATLLLDPILEKGGEEIDGVKLMLDGEENYLFFVNKKDSFLWEFKLK